MKKPSPRICIGAIAGAFGVRGEVRLKSFTADPEAIASYGALTTEDGARSFDIRITRAVKAGFAARLSGIGTKEEADALRGTRLYVERSKLPNPEEDEFYYADLIGLSAVDTGGATFGRITGVHDHGAGDLLDIRLASGGEVMIPFTREHVPTVDLAGGRVIVDPPEDMADD